MTKRTPTPLMLLLAFAAAALILIVLVSAATPTQAQSGLPWESIKATLIVWATQMPLNQVATQAAINGLQLPQPVYGTANALLAQMPAEAVFGTLVAPNFSVPGGQQPTAVPPTLPPPTAVPPTLTQPPVISPSTTPVVPPPGGQQPLPTATPMPGIPFTLTPVPSPALQTGRFSGQVLYPSEVEADSAGIQLVLTRPDGSTVTLPTRGNGVFTFSNMTPGTYTLETQAQGYLTNQITFELRAGEDRMLPTSRLIAGDTNGDNRVDLNDAALVASNFNGPAIVTEVDLNEDGWIDIIDLTLVGTAFGLAGPLPW
ncbi:MAG: carboxypeptidase regulatory-like domain-containing protein [Anaerolineaceae bacterium]|nr:carboxypeptidase regulatory-like domain-containing protein [Anaerolineaceae bacterium]